MTRARHLAWVTLALTACDPSTNPEACDEDAAFEIVYAEDGAPAIAGQALVIRSCGEGAFCHSEGIAPADRLGAPIGLEYDLRLASTTIEIEAGAVERLGRHQERLLANPNHVWGQVSSQRMPPSGRVGEVYLASVTSRFDRVADDGTTFTRLPSLETAAGRDIFRNWLSCGAPVIERTYERFDGRDNEVGFTAPACSRSCVDPTWPAIYDAIVAGPAGDDPDAPRQAGRCALSLCHSEGERAGGLALDGGPAAAHAALLGAVTAEESCAPAGDALVVPGDPEASLLYQKVALPSGDLCGTRMPPSGNRLDEQRRCAIREWIACGACRDPSDPACADCLGDARAACGFDPGEPSGCAEIRPCPNRLPE